MKFSQLWIASLSLMFSLQETSLVASFLQKAGRRVTNLKAPTTQPTLRTISTISGPPETQLPSSTKAQMGGLAAFPRSFSSKTKTTGGVETITSEANPSYPYLNNFLPEDSEIIKRCNEAKPTFFQKTFPRLFKTDIQNGCDYIEDILHRMHVEESKQFDTDSYWGSWSATLSVMANSKLMKDAVKKALFDMPYNIQEKEFENISKAASKIKEHRTNELKEKIAEAKNRRWERDKKEFKETWEKIMKTSISDETLRQEWFNLINAELKAGTGIRDYDISLKELKKTRAKEEANSEEGRRASSERAERARRTFFEDIRSHRAFFDDLRSGKSFFEDKGNAKAFFKNQDNNNRKKKKPSEPKNIEDARTTLDVSSDATEEEIKKKHHNLVLKWHPDVNKSPNATQKFQEINNARDLLLQNVRSTR